MVTHYVTYARLGQLKKRAREGLLGLLVVTGDAESYSLLTDLPTMSLEFLEAMDKLTYHVRKKWGPGARAVRPGKK